MRTETMTYFVTGDGQRFTDAAAAARHEVLVAEVAEIMAPLGDVPDGTNFTNGHGHIPHTAAALETVRRAVAAIGKRERPSWEGWDAFAEGNCHISWPARMVDNGGPSELRTVIHRLYCTDDQGREWGQPYFASHPDRASDMAAIR